MPYFASSGVAPSCVARGPQTYMNPYYKTSCGCGSANNSYELTAPNTNNREGFGCGARPSGGNGGGGNREGMNVACGPCPVAAPSCTLTATAPPAGCCHPAPLHCSCCNGSGYFNASEAYGS